MILTGPEPIIPSSLPVHMLRQKRTVANDDQEHLTRSILGQTYVPDWQLVGALDRDQD